MLPVRAIYQLTCGGLCVLAHDDLGLHARASFNSGVSGSRGELHHDQQVLPVADMPLAAAAWLKAHQALCLVARGLRVHILSAHGNDMLMSPTLGWT